MFPIVSKQREMYGLKAIRKIAMCAPEYQVQVTCLEFDGRFQIKNEKRRSKRNSSNLFQGSGYHNANHPDFILDFSPIFVESSAHPLLVVKNNCHCNFRSNHAVW